MTTKSFFITFALLLFFSIPTWAQLKEVRGVQTRSVQDTYRIDSGTTVKTRAYEFLNENPYPVWVEAELWTYGFTVHSQVIKEGVRDTKNFKLEAGEKYVWKCGERMIFNYNYDYSPNFYVRYKAYKEE